MLDSFNKKGKLANKEASKQRPFAIVAPHAGYYYSGQTASNTYIQIKQYNFKKAIIIAPLHNQKSDFDYFIGDYEGYETPLGIMETDREIISDLLRKQGFGFAENIDSREHSLEVHLPFLLELNHEIKIVPILFCKQNLGKAEYLANSIKNFLTDETILVISTDLSHFHDAKTAELMDRDLIDKVLKNDINGLYRNIMKGCNEACGFGGLLTLMFLASIYENITITDFEYTHSGLITHDENSVVGYFGCVYRREEKSVI
jgi:hypothetical protein